MSNEPDIPFDVAKFEQFIDDELSDSDAPLTIDDLAALLRRMREYLAEEQCPIEFQILFFDKLIGPMLVARGPSGADRVEMERKFSEAIGFQVVLPS